MSSVIFWIKKKSQTNETKSKLLSKQKKQSKNETVSAGDVVSLSGEKQSKDSKNGSWFTPAQKAFVVVIFSFYQKREGHL